MGRRGKRVDYGLLYVLCDESELDQRAILGRFVEVCRCQKVNVNKRKVMVLNRGAIGV